MPDTVFEVHSSIVTRHSIHRDGEDPLIQEKRDTTVTRLGSGNIIKKFHIETHRIGQQSVIYRNEDGKVVQETKMSQQELEEFNTLWEKEWQPSIRDELKTKASEMDPMGKENESSE